MLQCVAVRVAVLSTVEVKRRSALETVLQCAAVRVGVVSTVEAKRRSTLKTQKLRERLDLMKSLSPDCGASGHSWNESAICIYE